MQYNQQALQALASELAKGIKTEADLNALSRQLIKLTVETALNAELTEHLGYDKHTRKPKPRQSFETDAQTEHDGAGDADIEPHQVSVNARNTRNGSASKRLKGTHGDIEISIPRDREASFEPQLVRKHQTRLTQMDEQILSLYAKGLTTREIVATFKDMYDADVSPALVSKVTDRVLEQITAWQSRPLDSVYAIVYLECIVLKIRDNMRVINKAIYVALGVDMDGRKQLLGLWMSQNEGAKFWLSVLTQLKSRGLQDILFTCVDGLKGFPEAIGAEYPHTKVQLCIVHMVRNSLRFVSWKDYKAVAADLKRVYQATTEALALSELERFEALWGTQYPQIAKSWTLHWANLRTIFEYPPDIRKAIYTTNAIESLNSVIRAATKRRKLFPSDDSAMKVVYLAIEQASKKWTMPIHNWRQALARFQLEFGGRINVN
jgi:putative transposase